MVKRLWADLSLSVNNDMIGCLRNYSPWFPVTTIYYTPCQFPFFSLSIISIKIIFYCSIKQYITLSADKTPSFFTKNIIKSLLFVFVLFFFKIFTSVWTALGSFWRSTPFYLVSPLTVSTGAKLQVLDKDVSYLRVTKCAPYIS